MTQEQTAEVERDVSLAVVEQALAEAQSAKAAAEVARLASAEAQGTGMPGDIRREWARLSRDAVGLALAHWVRVKELMPGSSVLRETHESLARAKAQARAAENACGV